MEQQRLDKFVFINYNKRLYERFQMRWLRNKDEDFDPIHVEELNYNCEWMARIPGAANEFVYGEDGLIWTQVDMAIGAFEFNLGYTKSVKSTQVTQALSTSPTTRGRGHWRAKGRGNIVKIYSRKGKQLIVEEEEEEWEESEENEEEGAYKEEGDD